MPVAQSFIQILGTFLAPLFIFIASLFSFIKLAPLTIKQLKTIGRTRFILKKYNLIYQRENAKDK